MIYAGILFIILPGIFAKFLHIFLLLFECLVYFDWSTIPYIIFMFNKQSVASCYRFNVGLFRNCSKKAPEKKPRAILSILPFQLTYSWNSGNYSSWSSLCSFYPPEYRCRSFIFVPVYIWCRIDSYLGSCISFVCQTRY